MHEFLRERATEGGTATAALARMAPVTFFYSGLGVGLG